MADQVTGTASGATGQSLGGLGGVLQGGVNNILNSGQNILDRFFPPEKREALWAKLTKFATEKPMLASFLLSQIALSGVPLGLFAVMTVGVLVFALVAALVIAVLGAVLFTVVALGFALIILLPTLFVTTFAAAFLWLWGVGLYYIVKWFNEKDVPGIHTGMAEGLLDQSGIKENLPDLNGNGETKGPREYDLGDEKKSDAPPKKQPNAGSDEKKGTEDNRTKSPNTTKTAGENLPKTGDMKKKLDVGNVNKSVNGVKGSLPGGVVA